jgi:hypothetical protein
MTDTAHRAIPSFDGVLVGPDDEAYESDRRVERHA